MRVLNPEEGEALALAYLADVNTLNNLLFAVMQSELRKRRIDDVLVVEKLFSVWLLTRRND